MVNLRFAGFSKVGAAPAFVVARYSTTLATTKYIISISSLNFSIKATMSVKPFLYVTFYSGINVNFHVFIIFKTH